MENVDKLDLGPLCMELRHIMEEVNERPMSVAIEPSKIAYSHIHVMDTEGETPTELVVGVCSKRQDLTVERVFMNKRRHGGMTKVFWKLKEYAREHDIQTITIQSVVSYEMVQWCSKYGFWPVESSGTMCMVPKSFEDLDERYDKVEVFLGNYVYNRRVKVNPGGFHYN